MSLTCILIIIQTSLITGFDPFGGDETNSSWAAVSSLPDNINGWHIEKHQLPTVFDLAGQLISDLITELCPDIIINAGQSGGSTAIRVERVAVNLMGARFPDNSGAQPIDIPVCADGPAAYFAKLPVKDVINDLTARKIPAEISYSAGTYVCNSVMYRVLHLLRDDRRNEYLSLFAGTARIRRGFSDGLLIFDRFNCAIRVHSTPCLRP